MRRDAWILLLALVVVVGVRHRACLEVGFVGWDTYPAIAHASALAGPWMGGTHPDATFYRPLTSVTLAIDRALHGADPVGYHVTDLALLCAIAVAVAALVRRLVRTASVWLAAGAGAIVAMHPIQVEIVPVVARRGDAIALLATLVVGLLACRRGLAARVAIVAVAAGAVLAKETGVLAVAVAPIAAWLVRRPILAPTVAAGLGVAGAFGLRGAVVGVFVGHHGREGWFDTVWRTAPDYAAWLIDPLGWAPVWLAPTALAALVVAGSVLPPVPRRIAAAGGVWALAAVAVFAAAGRAQPWYTVHLVVPLALVGAACVAGAVDCRRRGRRLAGAVALVGTVVVVASAFAPVDVAWRQWREGSAQVDRYLDRLERVVRASDVGATLVVPLPPLGIERTRPGLPLEFLLTDYALPDALRVRGVARPIVAHFSFRAAPAGPPDATRLVVTPGEAWP